MQYFKKPVILVVLLLASISTVISAEQDNLPPKKMIWPFDGMFGRLDVQSAQRGFHVYKEVCSACHSMQQLAYRNLENIGFSPDEVKAIAKDHMFYDGPNDEGEMFERPGIPSDKFFNPYNNEKAARAANNGAYPPDLSLIIKARHDGANYVYSILTGYAEAPANFNLDEGMYYNPYFHGSKIAMPHPLNDEQVSYTDGTRASVEQMARDIVVFLQWSAEPEMEHRKSMGLKVTIFLILWTVLFYVIKEKIWSRVK